MGLYHLYPALHHDLSMMAEVMVHAGTSQKVFPEEAVFFCDQVAEQVQMAVYHIHCRFSEVRIVVEICIAPDSNECRLRLLHVPLAVTVPHDLVPQADPAHRQDEFQYTPRQVVSPREQVLRGELSVRVRHALQLTVVELDRLRLGRLSYYRVFCNVF